MMKLFLLLILLLPLAFAADWRTIGGLAIVTSAIILAMVYGIGYGFGINELKFLATEELYQLVATIFMIGLIIGAEGFLNQIAIGLGSETLPDAALVILDDRLDSERIVLNNLQGFSVRIGEESSKSAFCTIYGVGVGMNSCGSYRALSTPLSLAYQMLGVGVAELGALNTLVTFAKQYAFIMLLPAGLLLRTFRITRGGGGLFIGFALAIYILIPLGVIAMDDVSDQALEHMEEQGRAVPALGGLPDVPACDAVSASEANYDRAEDVFNNLSNEDTGLVRAYIYEFLINATLLTLVSLSIMLAGIRAIAALAGAEVDVSGLARLA